MSSSNSNRGGRFGYQGSKDWINNNKSRRKNFYSSSATAAAAANTNSTDSGPLNAPSSTTPIPTPSNDTTTVPNLSRRDFKSNGPGSSSLTHLKDSQQPTRNGSSYTSNYYSNLAYGSYDNGLYRSDTWRRTSGESRRLAGSQKPTLSGSSSGSLTSTSSPTGSYKNGRYDSYTTDPTTSYGPRWKGGRNFASSTRFSAKDRIRNGKPSLSNLYLPNSNNVPLGASSASNSFDSYSPATNSSSYKYYGSPKAYGSYYSNSYPKDKSSSLSQLRPPYSNPRYYKSRYGSRYGGSTLINPAEKRAKQKELEGEQDSQNDYDNEDDNVSKRHTEDDTQSEMTENEERDIEIKERIARENIDADETQDDTSQQAIKQELIETSAEPELKDDEFLHEIYAKKVRIETPPVVAEVESNVKIEYDESDAVEGTEEVYRYPLLEIPYKYEEMKKEFQQSGAASLKYLLATPIEKFTDYPFFINNYEEFHRRKRAVLTNLLKERNTNIESKTSALSKEYQEMLKKWEERRQKMEQQLRVLHLGDDEMRRELDSSDLRKQNQQQEASVGNTSNSSPHVGGSFDLPTVSSRRSSRRHGDLVTTEAEFQEILLSLGQEQEDPLLKARRVAADIPDMVMGPVERKEVKFMDSNNIVRDKEAWASRVNTDFRNTFSDVEHALFTEAFCLFPKRFGAISRYMGGLRTSAECVLHYYMTKKSVNYKQLLIQRRKASKKSKRVKSAGRPKSTSQQQQPVTQVEEVGAAPTSAVSELIHGAASTNLDGSTGFEMPVMTPVMEAPEIPAETGRKKRATGTKVSEKRKAKAEAELVADGEKPVEKKRKKTTKKTVSSDGGVSKPTEKKKRMTKKQAAEEALAAAASANANAVSDVASNVSVVKPELTKVSIGALTLNYPSTNVQSEIYTGAAPIVQQYVYQQQQQQQRQQPVSMPAQYSQPLDEQKSYPKQYEQQLQFQHQQQQQQKMYAHYQAQYQTSYQSEMSSFVPQRSAPVFPSIRNLLSDQQPTLYQPVAYTPVANNEQQQLPLPQQQQQLQQQQAIPTYQSEVSHAQPSIVHSHHHHKSSIMSLLNSDEKPTTPTSAPAAATQHRTKTNLRDLLN